MPMYNDFSFTAACAAFSFGFASYFHNPPPTLLTGNFNDELSLGESHAFSQFRTGNAPKVLGFISLMMIAPAGFSSVLSDLAATVQPGTFVELEIDGDISTCQAMIPPLPLNDPDTGDEIPQRNYLGNILEFTDEALWDPTGRDIYIMGTRRPYKRWDQGFVKYSEETNSWEILDLPPFGVGAHGYDNAALDAQRREYYWSRIGMANNVWAMDLATQTWRRLPDAPIQAGQFSAIEYFPELDRLVFFDGLNASEYALYNPETAQWEDPTVLTDVPFGAVSHFSEYNPNHGVMLFGGGYNYTAGGTIPDPTPDVDESRRFYMLDREKTVTRLADAPTKLGQFGVGPVQTIDPNSGNLVVFQGQPNDGSSPCPDPLPVWEYDLGSDTWNQTGTQQLSDRWCRMNTVAVPLYEYGVNFVVSVKNETDCRVHLYRHSPMEPIAPTITTQPVSPTIEEGSAAIFSVIASGSAPLAYQWYRDDIPIPGATQSRLVIEPVTTAVHGARYHNVVTNSLDSATSDYATLSVVPDTTAPILSSVAAFGNTRVNIVFSEPVSVVGSEDAANYQIDLGIVVTSVALSENGRMASLTISPLAEGTTYTVQVSNVQDRAQTPNTIAALSSASFIYRTVDDFEGGTADGWTPLTPANWSVVMDEGDQAYYLNTTAFASPGGGRLGEYSLLPGTYGDFTFSAQARLGDDVTSNAFADYAVVFGFQDADNYYYVLFNNDQDATQLFKVVEGNRSALATAGDDWLNDNAYHSVKVSRVGSNIKIHFDDNLIMSTSDSTFGAGRVGVGSFNDAAYFDEVRVSREMGDGNSTEGGSTEGGSTENDSTGGGTLGGWALLVLILLCVRPLIVRDIACTAGGHLSVRYRVRSCQR